ncbi:MAG: SIS domain-containing protein [Alphaproteobacteria bacterium]|nr:SIS domain-containing protein [Alphaproteobacteria bacterium]
MHPCIMNALTEAQTALAALIGNTETQRAIDIAGHFLIDTLKHGGRVYSCGNGGSMSDAMHFAEELSGRYRRNRPALGAAAISDVGHLTCVSNDFGYDSVFSRYLEGHARDGDCLLAISTSGKSPNILKAVELAKSRNVKVIGLTGPAQSPLAQAADVTIATPGGQFADRVQELHIKVIHILIEIVERELFPENYNDLPV